MQILFYISKYKQNDVIGFKEKLPSTISVPNLKKKIEVICQNFCKLFKLYFRFFFLNLQLKVKIWFRFTQNSHWTFRTTPQNDKIQSEVAQNPTLLAQEPHKQFPFSVSSNFNRLVWCAPSQNNSPSKSGASGNMRWRYYGCLCCLSPCQTGLGTWNCPSGTEQVL